MIDKFDVLEYLKEHPKYADILKLAVEVEETHAEEEHWLGWEWHKVQAHPSTINKLVVDGLVEVNFHSANFTHYKLRDLEATKEALRNFEALKRQPVPVEEKVEVPPDLFSVIVGYDDVKELVKKALSQEKPVGFLLVGPVATAKSLFLEELNRVPGSSYHLGSSSSKAGLTQFLLDVRPRLLLIDELDKMSRNDYACLLSVMESGKVVETKYGRRREEYMKVWVFASCNSLKGIPPENVSRFKPYVFHFREYSKEEFIEVVEKVLVEREGVNPQLASYIAKKVSPFTRDVRAARGLGRLCKTEEEVDKHVQILNKYRGFKT